VFEGLNLEAILIGAVVLVAAIILIIIIVGGIKSAKKGNNELNDNKKEEAAPVVEEVKEEVKPMKVVLAPGDSVVVGSEGRIPCGEYTLESSDGSETFNVRIGRYVKEYANGCTVVLTEKQKVTAINTTIIIK
jgi:hypothetical protein